ncbi:NUDIX hydrolase [Dethiothermospora halolimnae]|uniref:NUDIX hydrolase n=1 Tax=Dethiothermospora halolimnae TaxID=3114390 RepID=UPI003CCBC079
MTYEEKTMKSEKIYEGKVLNLRLDTVELPDKKYTKREIVEHPGAVAIIPITEEGEIILVKQFRKAIEDESLEIPAGSLEKGEDPTRCAIRELKEETGVTASEVKFLLEFYTSPGYSNEKMHLFLARKLKKGVAEPENDEYIDIVKMKLEDLMEKINNGEIADSKTIIGLLKLKEILKEEL